MRSSPVVRAAFGALVLATVAAFFVTQQLKGETPTVLRFATSPDSISPNGDGVRDGALLGFDLSERAEVSFAVIDTEGREVRRLADDRDLAGDTKHRFRWDGRDDDGEVVPDGVYRMRLIRRDEGGILDSFKEVLVDTRPPRVRIVSARPGVISTADPRERPYVRIRYRGPRNKLPEIRVFRTDGGPVRVVSRFRGDKTRSAFWDGLLRGSPAEDGSYAFSVTVRDRAGNRAVAPPGELPSAGNAPAGTGVAVRNLTLTGPLGVVPAGSLARLEVGPRPRRFEFALSRLGSRKTLRKGRRRAGRFRVRVPPRSRTGVYVLRVRAANGRRARWPLAVAGLPVGGRRARRRARPLVVLPVATWQGRGGYDDDLDGFADSLDGSRAVRVERPFARGRLPRQLRTEAEPLLAFLERERLPYDLSTDLALERREGPRLGNAPGVAIAGSMRWALPGVRAGLLRYVRDGGRVAVFGADSLRRTARLDAGLLRVDGRVQARDLFGEGTRTFSTTPAPLVVERDELGLFGGLDGLVGEFSRFERSTALPAGSRLLVAAGRETGQPAFVAYRRGRGLVIRVGSPEWTGLLPERRLELEVPRVTSRIWKLLRRR